jgi:hypothetical protein
MERSARRIAVRIAAQHTHTYIHTYIHTYNQDVAATLAWSAVPDASRYEVQLKEAGADWTTVSDSLKSTMARKKNLKQGTKYLARMRARDAADASWGDYCPEVEFETLVAGVLRMEAPTLMVSDGEGCLYFCLCVCVCMYIYVCMYICM